VASGVLGCSSVRPKTLLCLRTRLILPKAALTTSLLAQLEVVRVRLFLRPSPCAQSRSGLSQGGPPGVERPRARSLDRSAGLPLTCAAMTVPANQPDRRRREGMRTGPFNPYYDSPSPFFIAHIAYWPRLPLLSPVACELERLHLDLCAVRASFFAEKFSMMLPALLLYLKTRSSLDGRDFCTGAEPVHVRYRLPSCWCTVARVAQSRRSQRQGVFW